RARACRDRLHHHPHASAPPSLLTLARADSTARDQSLELMQHYGQKLFSQLWTAPRARIIFEKDADLLTDVAEMPGEANVSDWALETLRLVQDLDQLANFDPTSIPAYTKDGFAQVQKL